MKKYVALALILALLPMLQLEADYSSSYDYGRSEFGAVVRDVPIAPDGTPAQCDFPRELHIRNTGGSDGSGLCVFASACMAAMWQNVEQCFGLFNWMKRHPGGGWPEKLDRMIEQYCREQNVPKPDYIQAQEDTLRTLQLACKTGRMVGVTYCYSPSGRYGGSKISHMVNVIHCDEKYVCVLDNNFPGSFEWCTTAEFLACSRCGGRNLWCVVFLNPGPPPSPKN